VAQVQGLRRGDLPIPRDFRQLAVVRGGGVGYLPVSEEFAVEIKPKVGVHNLFRMLE